MNKKLLPERKPTRLKGYDYGFAGAYLITVCIRERMQILSEIELTSVEEKLAPHEQGESPEANIPMSVGGLAPPEQGESPEANIPMSVGEGLAPPAFVVKLKPCGEIVKEELLTIQNRFSNVKVPDYVIMPDHIHVIIVIEDNSGGASPSPTLNDVICAFKSLTTRICGQRYGMEKMWQRSYADHIIRDKRDYETRRKYIYENPMRWYYKHQNGNNRCR